MLGQDALSSAATGLQRKVHTVPTMKTTRRLPALLAVSIGALVLACGGTTPGGGAGGPGATTAVGGAPDGGAVTGQPAGGGQVPDACTLLTDADIEEATGNSVTLKEPEMQSGLLDAGCHWVLKNADSIVPPEIHFEIMYEGGLDYYKRYFEPFNAENGYETIEGIGDIAVDADFGSILVVAGDVFFDLQDLAFGSEKNNQEALAKKVVENLAK